MDEPNDLVIKPVDEYKILKNLLPGYKLEYVDLGIKIILTRRHQARMSLDPHTLDDEKEIIDRTLNQVESKRQVIGETVSDIRLRLAELYEKLTDKERKEHAA